MLAQLREEAVRDLGDALGIAGLNGAPDLWKELGADGFAQSADAALAVAEELVTAG